MIAVLNAIRSVIFNLIFYAFNVVYMLCYMLPLVLFTSRQTVRRGVTLYCIINRFLARWIMGITCEWRGAELVPQNQALILAAAHQSYFDPMLADKVRNDVTALAKVELKKVPVIGMILPKIGAVFVDRKAGNAREQMREISKDLEAHNTPLIIYPQATRVVPGSRKDLKAGVYHVARDTGLKTYTVATNAGLFWTRGFFHRPGKAIFEVVRELDADMGKEAFMQAVEEDVVFRSEELCREVGFAHLMPAVDAQKT